MYTFTRPYPGLRVVVVRLTNSAPYAEGKMNCGTYHYALLVERTSHTNYTFSFFPTFAVSFTFLCNFTFSLFLLVSFLFVPC